VRRNDVSIFGDGGHLKQHPRQAQALSVESNNYHKSMWDSRKSSQPDLSFNSFNSMLVL
jgi:hypothetical protein